MRFFFLLILLLVPPITLAASLCAINTGPTYASIPALGQQKQPSGSGISKGTEYALIAKRSEYVQVQVNGRPVWAEDTLFGTASACAKSAAPNTAPAKPIAKSMPSPAQASITTSSPNRRKAAPSASSGCSCGSGRVCVGRRGGRYCIASGGKKRYGV